MTYDKGFSAVTGNDVKNGAMTIRVPLLEAVAGEARLTRVTARQPAKRLMAVLNARRAEAGKPPRKPPAKKTTVTNMILDVEAVDGDLVVQLPARAKPGDKIFWDAYSSAS